MKANRKYIRKTLDGERIHQARQLLYEIGNHDPMTVGNLLLMLYVELAEEYSHARSRQEIADHARAQIAAMTWVDHGGSA